MISGGQRNGSTLVQRLLTSHPGVMIWGEHGGHLGGLLAAADGMITWSESLGPEAQAGFTGSGYQSWMANLSPGAATIRDAARQFILTMFALPAAGAGCAVWGFKEVLLGMGDVRRLHGLFPQMAVIAIVRDPRDVLCSLDEWERHAVGKWDRAQTVNAVAHWLEVAGEFGEDEGAPRVLWLRYEDLTLDPARTCVAIGRHTGLDPSRFDQEVFSTRIRVGDGMSHLERDVRAWDELPSSLRSLLASSAVKQAAHRCGYDLDDRG